MAKQGLIHDYDLHANLEPAAQKQTCVVCGTSPMTFQWSDFSGEGMCTQCGCAYQLKWGSDKQKQVGNYPYCNIKDEWIPILKEYWNETKKFVTHGRMMGGAQGVDEFYNWVKIKHPELMK